VDGERRGSLLSHRLANLGLCGRQWRHEIEQTLLAKGVAFESNAKRKSHHAIHQTQVESSMNQREAQTSQLILQLKEKFKVILKKSSSSPTAGSSASSTPSFSSSSTPDSQGPKLECIEIDVEDDVSEDEQDVEEGFAAMSSPNAESSDTLNSLTEEGPRQKRLRESDITSF